MTDMFTVYIPFLTGFIINYAVETIVIHINLMYTMFIVSTKPKAAMFGWFLMAGCNAIFFGSNNPVNTNSSLNVYG